MRRRDRDGWADVGGFGFGGFGGAGEFGDEGVERRGFYGRWAGASRPEPGAPIRLSPFEWLRRLVAFLLDSRVPAWKKGLFAAGLLYLLVPFDLAPDLLPMLGWFDDLAVLWFGLRALSRELARYVPPAAPGAWNGPGTNGSEANGPGTSGPGTGSHHAGAGSGDDQTRGGWDEA